MSAWRPVLRLAARDARRHLLRTVLATVLIALPVAGLIGFISLANPGTTTREQALASIPEGAQAVVTATAIPGERDPFPQLPEGAPGPWMDDPETMAASTGQIGDLLDPDAELAEYWLSPPLIAAADLGLEAGEQRDSVIDAVASRTDLGRLGTARLVEAEQGALALLAPSAVEGKQPTSSDEVLVTRALAERLDVTVGGTLAFVAPPDSGVRSSEGTSAAAMEDSARGYRVSGITDAAGNRAWAPADWLSGLVATNPIGVQGHWLVLGDEPVTWAQAKELNKLQAFAVSRYVLEHYPSAGELYPVPIDPLRYIEAAVGVALVAIIGGMLVLFLVTPALAISAEQSRRTLGLAAAAGAAPRDLRRSILAQGLVLGCLGGVLGVIIGIGAALGLNAWFGTLQQSGGDENPEYGVTQALAHFPWWTLPVGVAIAILLGEFAALGPARSAARMAPVDAIRDRRPAARRTRKRRLLGLIAGPVLLVLAVTLAAVTLFAPIPAYPTSREAIEAFSMRGTGGPPPGSDLLVLCAGLAIAAAAFGLALTVRSLLPRIGRLGSRSRPDWRLALRDAADHPSRTVPAVLGVVFSLLAASYLLTFNASSYSNYEQGGTSLEWQGTFFVAPTVPVSPEFDRMVARSVLDETMQDRPEVIGALPVQAVHLDSSVQVEARPAEGTECGRWEAVHVSSARQLGAPMRCVSVFSGAQYRGGLKLGSPFSTWVEPLLMSGDALRATRIAGVETAAAVLDQGGVVVGNASLIDDQGMVRLVAGPFADRQSQWFVDADREVLVPGAFLRGMGVGFVTSPEVARQLGVAQTSFVGLIAKTSTPIAETELRDLSGRGGVGELAIITAPTSFDVAGASSDPLHRAVVWAPIGLLALVALAATAVAVLLSATQARRDAATMHAVGAGRATLLRLALARAGVILAVGVPLGVAAGITLASYQVAWNHRLEASGAWLDTVVAWPVQLGIAAAVVLAGLATALILARPPRHFVRRSID